jgi:hypothetical protein
LISNKPDNKINSQCDKLGRKSFWKRRGVYLCSVIWFKAPSN